MESSFLPIDRMVSRINTARDDSDTALFLDLMYLGEMITKIVTAGLVAAVADDRHRHRYAQIYRLVRTNGIGDWSKAIDDILTGPAAQHLIAEARLDQRDLTSPNVAGTWQYEIVELINNCLQRINGTKNSISGKVSARRWFTDFATLRNKTRGHGALPSGLYSEVCPDLERSIDLLISNYRLFQRPWAYLHRNLSGKYRVTKLYPDSAFDYLKTRSEHPTHLINGVYVYYDKPVRVELIVSDVDATDFFVPNGGFTDKQYELLSYITNNKLEGHSAPYMVPASELPSSETEGLGSLPVQGNCFTNLPPQPEGYVRRQELEAELLKAIINDRHPVITLVGRGGIGKTSLTLSVLHHIAATEQRFTAVLWFSARDIDLLLEGAKLVKPHVLTEKDIAEAFAQLTEPAGFKEKGFKAIEHLAQSLTASSIGPLLFVFDNFETVRSPVELFTWIDTYIRLPNKILITTRYREFKGDYPVEVSGMTEQESDELISGTADSLGIRPLLTDAYRRDLYFESDGHPYIIKVLLGEVAKAGRVLKVERVVARKDELLDALFERTFNGLTPAAQRIFLTLCNWRSTLPQLAVEAVLLRHTADRMDIEAAIEETRRSSFVEVTSSQKDNETFLSVPLVASIFGKRKLAVSPMKNAIEADTQLLYFFGAGQQTDIQRGIAPRIERMFRQVADRVIRGNEAITVYLPMLEFIARKYPRAWLLIATLYEELGTEQDIERAQHAVRSYLEVVETDKDRQQAWKRLADLYRRTNDWSGEAQALVEMCQWPDVPFSAITYAASRTFSLFRDAQQGSREDKEIVIKRLVDTVRPRIQEGSAADYALLARLWIYLRNDERANEAIKHGLDLNQDDDDCLKVARLLSPRK